MKILITGANGMLAQAVRGKFDDGENELVLTDSKELDITNREAVLNEVAEIRPEVLINCAAYTNVDGAELNEDLARKVNADGPRNLAEACAASDVILVHVSTDYVFGGDKPEGEYSEDDEKAPKSVYGVTKLEGEEAITESGCKYYIFRTAWLYGEGKNFVRTMLGAAFGQIEKGAEVAKVSVVDDQWGSPTYTEDLAEMVKEAVDLKIPFGIYNATDLGNTNWAEFTEKIYEIAGVPAEVEKISSEEYERRANEKAAAEGVERKVAPRPKNSQLSKDKLVKAGVKVPRWEDSLKSYLAKEMV